MNLRIVKLFIYSLLLVLLLVTILVACNEKTITNTIIETRNQTLTQTEMLTKTQSQTVTQSETLTEKEKQTVTQTETQTEKQTETISTTTTITTTITTTTIPLTMSTPANEGNVAFSISDLTIIPRVPAVGAAFTVSVVVTNTGDNQGTNEVILYIDELNVEDPDNIVTKSTRTYSQEVTLQGSESITTIFSRLILQGGFYTATVGDLVDYFEVGS